MTSPKELATTYFDAWQAQDSDRLRTVFAEDATFRGPMGTADGADECVAGLRGLAGMMSGLEIKKMLADESDVITWYELRIGDQALPTVNWSHVEDGKIVAVRATFDPRPILSE